MLKIQEKCSLPGLVMECKSFISDLKLPDIFVTKMKRNKWKRLVKEAVLEINENELKHEIETSKKLKNSALVNESFGLKNYIKELSLHEARIYFKHRTKMTQFVKMNYKNEKYYSKKLWKCTCGKMDSESHLLWCKNYEYLRENKDLSNNKDLCQYLHKIFLLRTKKEKKK